MRAISGRQTACITRLERQSDQCIGGPLNPARDLASRYAARYQGTQPFQGRKKRNSGIQKSKSDSDAQKPFRGPVGLACNGSRTDIWEYRGIMTGCRGRDKARGHQPGQHQRSSGQSHVEIKTCSPLSPLRVVQMLWSVSPSIGNSPFSTKNPGP